MISHNIKSLPKAKDMTDSIAVAMGAETALKEWLNHPDTKKGYLGCKRRSVATALKEFKFLNDVTEFYMRYSEQTKWWKDDSLIIFYRQKTV